MYAYDGPQGVDQLDAKVRMSWFFIFGKYERSPKKYFLKVSDDSYVVGHNLMMSLMKLDRWFSSIEKPFSFGYPFRGHGDLIALAYARWCYAGGGAYGLHVEALKIPVRQSKEGCAYFYDYIVESTDRRPGDD